MNEFAIKEQVREFYNRVGWKTVSEGMYQNARYEDLRPVAHEYIHKCHLRVNRHLIKEGHLLLDAGCGPIQYPEYLTYSEGYHYRVCLDISLLALQEARKRIRDHGLFVVADVANMPFKNDCFDGIVSLHTLHHLPASDQAKAYQEFIRTLNSERNGVIVNGWTDSALMNHSLWLIKMMERLGAWVAHRKVKKEPLKPSIVAEDGRDEAYFGPSAPTGTYIQKTNSLWLKEQISNQVNYQVLVWRSVSVRFLRAIIHPILAGKMWLRLLFFLEERFAHFFGEKGQYPLIVIYKGKHPIKPSGE